jgi:hypothetical protein
MPKMHQNVPFSPRKVKIFWEGAVPLSRPLPICGLRPLSYVCSSGPSFCAPNIQILATPLSPSSTNLPSFIDFLTIRVAPHGGEMGSYSITLSYCLLLLPHAPLLQMARKCLQTGKQVIVGDKLSKSAYIISGLRRF